MTDQTVALSKDRLFGRILFTALNLLLCGRAAARAIWKEGRYD